MNYVGSEMMSFTPKESFHEIHSYAKNKSRPLKNVYSSHSPNISTIHLISSTFSTDVGKYVCNEKFFPPLAAKKRRHKGNRGARAQM
jgi:hypothetical protein